MNLLTVVPLGLGAILGLYLSAGVVDTTIYLHGILLCVSCVGCIFWVLGRDGDAGGPANPNATVNFNDGVIRAGVIATTVWGVVGFLVGLVIALQLAFPALNLDLPWTSFGLLRPLHTSAVIFAFSGNALMMTSFHVVQRTSRARLAGGFAPWFVFWGYQLFIILAATGYVFGATQGKEYAEPEWYVDLSALLLLGMDPLRLHVQCLCLMAFLRLRMRLLLFRSATALIQICWRKHFS